MISKTHTLDGVKVVPGLLVWDYDLRRRKVGEIAYWSRQHDTDPVADDPWFQMRDPETDTRGSDMNPSRMWVRRPGDGLPASAEPGLFDDSVTTEGDVS